MLPSAISTASCRTTPTARIKAAQSALSLLARWGGEAPELLSPLTALAQEETEHFAAVQARIAERGGRLGPPASDGYVVALQKAARDGGSPTRSPLLDRLLVSALIEARSCERFKLLATHLRSPELQGFYHGLMASEARHYRLFAGLAEQIFGVPEARDRLAVLAEREAAVADRLPLGPTVHG